MPAQGHPLETGQVAGPSGLIGNRQEPAAFRGEQELCRAMNRTYTNRMLEKTLLDYPQLEFLTSFLGHQATAASDPALPDSIPHLSSDAWGYSSPIVSGAAGVSCPKYISLSLSATKI